MRFKKLEINNLASIEEATIDFSGEELGNESLFLITGETGAGKTTLLDAICLALYNKVPRFEQYKNDKQDSSSKVKDVRQLLRRGAKKASVKLTFVGNDGESEYVAEWIAELNKKNNLNSVVRHLTLPTRKKLEKSTEVANKLEDIIGISFTDFCRTTLLAQGEFDRFLKGEAKEKSNILGKLVGTAIFEKVGKKIFEIHKSKEAAWKKQDTVLETKKKNLLSPEEQEDKAKELDEKKGELKGLEVRSTAFSTKKKWLEDTAKAEEKRKKWSEEKQQLEEVRGSEKFQNETKTLADWEASAEARRLLNDSDQATKELSDLQKNENALKQEAGELYAQNQFVKREINQLDDAISQTKQQLEAQQAHEAMFGAVEVIKQHLKQVLDAQRKIKQYTSEKETAEAKVKELTKQKTSLDGQCTDLEGKLNENEVATKKKKEERDALDPNGVNERMKNSYALQGKLEKIGRQWEDICTKKDSLNKAIKKQAELEETIQNLKKAIDVKTGEVKTLEGTLKATREAYDKAFTSTKDWVKEVRKQLHAGDICPVCGKKVETALSDEPFSETFKHYEDLKNQQQKQFDETQNELAGLKATKDATKKQLDDNVAEQEKQQNQLTQALSTLKELCNGAGMAFEGDFPAEQLEARKDAVAQALKEINQKQEQIKRLNQELDGLSTGEEKLRKLSEETKKRLGEIELDLTSANGIIDNCTKNIAEQGQAAEKGMADAGERISWENWEKDFAVSPVDFQQKLQTAAQRYGKLKAQAEKQQDTLGELQQLWSNAVNACREHFLEADLQKIAPALPEGTTHSENLPEQWHELNKGLLKNKEQLNNQNERIAQNKQKIDAFYAAHQEINSVRMQYLLQQQESEIQSLKNKHQKNEREWNELLGQERQLLQTEKELQEKKPTFEPEENWAFLAERLQECEAQKGEINQRIGELKQQLKTDEETRKQCEKDLQKLEELQQEENRWAHLNGLFGSSQGDTFRIIALSFVLRDLLQMANEHLSRFTNNRYTLTCEVGSFNIRVIDNFSGSEPRNASTLSGGESFMVSLALAIALANMNTTQSSCDTLFIDEGFGSLDEKHLDDVITCLEKLQQSEGKKVGIISHVDMLKTRIPTRIDVERTNATTSKVVVRSGLSAAI